MELLCKDCGQPLEFIRVDNDNIVVDCCSECDNETWEDGYDTGYDTAKSMEGDIEE